MTPQKHCELIKAWADGATIEYRHYDGSWKEAEKPVWYELTEYRVKPKKELILTYLSGHTRHEFSNYENSMDPFYKDRDVAVFVRVAR